LIKLVFTIRRPPRNEREMSFQRYWRTEHARLVERQAEVSFASAATSRNACPRKPMPTAAISQARGSGPGQYDGLGRALVG